MHRVARTRMGKLKFQRRRRERPWLVFVRGIRQKSRKNSGT